MYMCIVVMRAPRSQYSRWKYIRTTALRMVSKTLYKKWNDFAEGGKSSSTETSQSQDLLCVSVGVCEWKGHRKWKSIVFLRCKESGKRRMHMKICSEKEFFPYALQESIKMRLQVRSCWVKWTENSTEFPASTVDNCLICVHFFPPEQILLNFYRRKAGCLCAVQKVTFQGKRVRGNYAIAGSR